MVTFYELYFPILVPWGCLGFFHFDSRFISKTPYERRGPMLHNLRGPKGSCGYPGNQMWSNGRVSGCPSAGSYGWSAFALQEQLVSLSVVVHSQLSYRIWFESCGYSDGAQNQEMRRNISELGATSSVTDPSRAALRSSVLRERRKNSECIHTFVSWYCRNSLARYLIYILGSQLENASSSIIIFKWLELWYDSVWNVCCPCWEGNGLKEPGEAIRFRVLLWLAVQRVIRDVHSSPSFHFTWSRFLQKAFLLG